MDVKKIYENRFSDTEARKILWETLVRYFFQGEVSSSDTILDMPCGYGEFINNIKCKKKFAIDINDDSKKYLGKDVEFIKASSLETGLAKGSVDKVFISNFFEHITREDIYKTVSEVNRILKRVGR